MADWRKKRERKEIFIRIIVLIISWIVLVVWECLVIVFAVINWLIVLFIGKRNRGIAKFCEIWNTQNYVFIRYMIFVSNKRPFPFSHLEPNISSFA